jgi:hypothetical protein
MARFYLLFMLNTTAAEYNMVLDDESIIFLLLLLALLLALSSRAGIGFFTIVAFAFLSLRIVFVVFLVVKLTHN